MKISHFLLLTFLFSYLNIFSQINLVFLENKPFIDGLPDETIMQKTNSISLDQNVKSDKNNPDFEVNLRMAYGTEFLYLLLEVNSDSIIYRDRAYQNGDGFHMTIARPKPDNSPSDEFYVLRFSPENVAKNQSSRVGIWYYNIDLQSKPLSQDAMLKTAIYNHKTYYEALIPWKEIHPFHPFIEKIGLNICFVKAINKTEKNNYFLVKDELMQSEVQKRKYLTPELMVPVVSNDNQSFVFLNRNNCFEGDSLKATIVSISPENTEMNIAISLYSGENEDLYNKIFRVHFLKGINVKEFRLPVTNFSEGGYAVKCFVKGIKTNDQYFTVLPELNYKDLKRLLDQFKISEGSYNTLKYKLIEIANQINNLKPYEKAAGLRLKMKETLKIITENSQGNDIYKFKTGVSRRAFFSNIDSTYRPYSVKIPKDYNSGRKYPLLVFLHGSGEDDSGILSYTSLSEGNFIEIAPNGRGVSNCYTIDNSQEDIKEAIDDAIKCYSIDTSKIIIGGFSMGGYGAYRTFYETPKRYKAVVVFSGHPNLASKWIGPGHPDFLNKKFLKPFTNIPIFIYHNENDRNCPFELTKQLVDKFMKAGAKVEFVTTADGGHMLIDEASKKKYDEWLRKNLAF